MTEATTPVKKRVLFVCTHNSARSQMAEGILRAFYGDEFEAFSAGTTPTSINPFAVTAMSEWGVDISKHESNHVEAFSQVDMDYVVTVCDSARETCPFVPARIENTHQPFSDPSDRSGTDTERLAAFREARNAIKAWIDEYFEPVARARTEPNQ